MRTLAPKPNLNRAPPPAPANLARPRSLRAEAENLEAAPRSSGQPLNATTRELMESRFRHDFSHVRVHADDQAASAAAALNALAYTAGRDVVFGVGQYAPHSGAGQKLLAHELTHVVQQGAGLTGTAMKREIGEPGDPLEMEADRVASRVMDGGPLGPPISRSEAAGRSIQRQLIPVQGSPVPLAGPYTGYQPFPAAPPAPAPQAKPLAQELQTLIDGATWKEIRKRVYPKESAAGIQRAKDRHAGKRPDLIGLGRLKTLDHFAKAVRGIQTQWVSFSSPDDRVKELGKAAGTELTGAGVPAFLSVDKKSIEFKAFFTPSEWKFTISEALVSGASLSDPDAGELTNTTLHESRHAEQHFLAARYAAGVKKQDAAAILAEHDIPKSIAEQAVAKKFDTKTDSATAALGKQMYQADVTDSAKNQAISDDDGLAELATKRATAQAALKKLEAAATPQTMADATAQRDALRAQITVVEQKYTLYRNIPYEADAHEVGDAAEQAFKGWK
jgi:hypothetical protein